MLEKCLVGRLVSKPSKKETPSNKSKPVINRLRFDFRQSNSKTLTCFIYTTCFSLTRENIFVNIENSKTILVLVYIDGFVHTIAIGNFIIRRKSLIRLRNYLFRIVGIHNK